MKLLAVEWETQEGLVAWIAAKWVRGAAGVFLRYQPGLEAAGRCLHAFCLF